MKNNQKKVIQVMNTFLDYNSNIAELETVDKALLLTLQNDNIHTFDKFIEYIEVFKKYNQIIQVIGKKIDRVTEINKCF